MPYDPKAMTDDQRTWSYKFLWLGLPASIMLLIGLLIDENSILITLSAGWVVGFFIGMAFVFRQDEFVQKQIAFAANMALSFAGIALFLQLPKVTLVLGEASAFLTDPALILASTAVVFHVSLAFRRLSER